MSAVRSRDHGYAALLKRVYGFGHPQVVMGILAEKGAEAKEGGEGNATLIEIANWMEFGVLVERPDGTVLNIPARSYIRAWYDEASPKMRQRFAGLMTAVLRGQRTKEQILELIGLKGQGEIQARIAAGIDPPNAASTIAKKGSSTPLIGESGQLRSAISYAVREGDE